jgi:hypothetical protein
MVLAVVMEPQSKELMTTAIVYHEVNDGAVWAKAWKSGPGSRHELFAGVGVKARTFRDPQNHHHTGLILEIADMAAFQAVLASPAGQQAMREDGLKVETMRLLVEFVP